MRKVFACLLFLLCIHTSSIAAVTVVGVGVTAGSADTNSVTTGNYNTTGANFIVLMLADYEAVGLSVISDSVNGTDYNANTWHQLTSRSSSIVARGTIFYAYSAIVGPTHTFRATKLDGSSYPSISVLAFSGVKTSPDPFDQQNGATGTSLSTLQTGSISASDGQLLISGAAWWVTATASINSSFTGIIQTNGDVSNHAGCAISYLIQSGAGSPNPTWSFDAPVSAGVAISSFNAATLSGDSRLLLLGINE